MRHLLAALALLAAPEALACGQSTHVWVGVHAVDHVPEGPLRTLLEAHPRSLVTGSMFPDGGYSPLANDGYGETAHWEPFQTTLLTWIRAERGSTWRTDDADLTAFLFGLAAHGMADQVFDGVYLRRSLVYDGEEAWATGDADLATDVVMADLVGPQPAEDLVPYDVLVEVFEAHGQPTDAQTMALGQTSLLAAVQFVGNKAAEPGEADRFRDQFPWATEHLTDPDVPGSPACIGEVVAAYWQTIWDRLEGDFDPDAQAVIAMIPAAEAWVPATAAADIESNISLVLARAVDDSSLRPRSVVVTGPDGERHPTGYGMYYGNGSNVLNLWPEEDWAEDTVYTVTVNPGVTSFDGVTISEPWSTTFTTAEPAGDDVATCGCRTAGGAAWLLGLVPLLGLRRRR